MGHRTGPWCTQALRSPWVSSLNVLFDVAITSEWVGDGDN